MMKFQFSLPENQIERFKDLRAHLIERGGNEIDPHSMIIKHMIIEDDINQIFWENFDGKTGVEPMPTFFIEKILQKMSKNKKVYYVITNYSEIGYSAVIEICKNNNIDIVRCHPWSYYNKNRKLCENAKVDLPKKFEIIVSFIGSLTIERKEFIEKAKNFYGFDEFIHINNVNEQKYVDSIKKTAYCLQPNGVGPRHQIYESMAIGTPSIIEENSYLHPDVIDCNIVINNQFPTKEELIQLHDKLSKKCKETYEQKMKLEKIVDEVLSSTIHKVV